MSVGTIKILLGIASIPLLLFLAGGVIYVYYLVYKWFIERLSRLRQLKMKYAKDTQTYKEVISSCHIEDEDAKKAREVENEFRKLTWGRLLFLVEEHYIITAFIAAIIVAALFVLVMIIYESVISSCCNCCEPHYVTGGERIVLAFVGILATFVVITNHAQTAEMSRRVDKQLEKNEKDMVKLKEDSINAQKNISDKTGELVSKAFSNNLEFINACQEKETLECARHIASTYVKNNSTAFEVRLIGGGMEYTESLFLIRRGERIYLQNADKSKTLSIKSEEIITIMQKEFNHQYIEELVFNLILINEHRNK